MVEESKPPHYLGWIFGALALAIASLAIATALPHFSENPYRTTNEIRQ